MLAIEKLTPYGDHLIVKVPNQTDLSQSNGGVYLVETIPNQERTSGIVYAIGLDHSSGRKPIPFKVGDTVFFKPYNGLEITEEYLIFRDIEIIGYREKEKENDVISSSL